MVAEIRVRCLNLGINEKDEDEYGDKEKGESLFV